MCRDFKEQKKGRRTMFKATMKNGEEIYLNDVSEMAKKEGMLDYASMVKWCTEGSMVGLNVSPWKLAEDWEKQTTSDFGYEEEEYEDEEDEEEEYDEEVFQWFIIDGESARCFAQFTNELIYYSEYLDMYLLGVTHFGTVWRGVLTEWKIEEE